jgi:hypothetical protein
MDLFIVLIVPVYHIFFSPDTLSCGVFLDNVLQLQFSFTLEHHSYQAGSFALSMKDNV